jgi:sulfate/thiosulfate transport system ATP-binding protein
MSIVVQNLSKSFGTFQALQNVSLEVKQGELVALLGPSGSGKTTLLRIIAGLDFPNPGEGTVLFEGAEVTNRNAGQRQVGFVFQHYALFRHLSVFENIAFGLRVRPRHTRPPEAEIRAKVEELLRLVQLEGLAHRYPSQLSGGQRQRIALARALAVEPKVLLLDEPFGALDAKVRKDLRRWLRRLHDEIHVTSLFVTHDQDEALEVADRIVVMNKGKVEQVGTPGEVYDHPINPFVYNFLGHVNLFHGRIESGQVRLVASALPASGQTAVDDAPAAVYVRPHDIKLTRVPEGDAPISATILQISSAGPVVRLELKNHIDGSLFDVEISREQHQQLNPQIGEQVHVQIKNMRVFTQDYSI